jgi:F-type H+/Na+-transporting ATPase subunit beta
MEELSEEDRVAVHRARRLQRFLTQPFTGRRIVHRYVRSLRPLQETLRGFRQILDGEHDDLPEQAFYMVGPSTRSCEKHGD